jgi:hypothetical protein
MDRWEDPKGDAFQMPKGNLLDGSPYRTFEVEMDSGVKYEIRGFAMNEFSTCEP